MSTDSKTKTKNGVILKNKNKQNIITFQSYQGQKITVKKEENVLFKSEILNTLCAMMIGHGETKVLHSLLKYIIRG